MLWFQFLSVPFQEVSENPLNCCQQGISQKIKTDRVFSKLEN